MLPSHQLVGSDFTRSAMTEICAMTHDVIEAMSHQELVDAIVNARLPFLRETDHERLPSLDRNTLERLIYLARQYCS